MPPVQRLRHLRQFFWSPFGRRERAPRIEEVGDRREGSEMVLKKVDGRANVFFDFSIFYKLR
jgi:hypothetical protein